MACCGDIPKSKNDGLGEHREGDILARPKWHAVQKTHGRVTSRLYGKINRKHSVWIDPRDFYANEWERVEDWAAASPSLEEIHAILSAPSAADPGYTMALAVAKAGVRVWSDPPIRAGLDMQQVPGEAGPFLAAMQAAGVKTVLEIGTGESGGFARFMVEVLGWNVVSVDINTPTPNGGAAWPDGWTFIQGDTTKIPLSEIPLPDGDVFDLVFIDGDHSYDGVKNDYERFGQLGRIVGFHDVAPDSWFKEGVQYWREISRDESGNLRDGWHEIILPQSRAGIGWIDDDKHYIAAYNAETAIIDPLSVTVETVETVDAVAPVVRADAAATKPAPRTAAGKPKRAGK